MELKVMKLLVIFAIVLPPSMASSQFQRWNNDSEISGHGDDKYYYPGDETDDPSSPPLRGRDNIGNIEVISHYHFHKYILEDEPHHRRPSRPHHHGHNRPSNYHPPLSQEPRCQYRYSPCNPAIRCCANDRSRIMGKPGPPLECRGDHCNVCRPLGYPCKAHSGTESPCCAPHSFAVAHIAHSIV